MSTPETPDVLNLDAATAALSALREMLAADGYGMSLHVIGPKILGIDVSAGPDSCPTCLVPKELMTGIAMEALGDATPVSRIEVSYPADGQR
jgi:hypothetical protein